MPRFTRYLEKAIIEGILSTYSVLKMQATQFNKYSPTVILTMLAFSFSLLKFKCSNSNYRIFTERRNRDTPDPDNLLARGTCLLSVTQEKSFDFALKRPATYIVLLAWTICAFPGTWFARANLHRVNGALGSTFRLRTCTQAKPVWCVQGQRKAKRIKSAGTYFAHSGGQNVKKYS
jgi:hypothetical protein